MATKLVDEEDPDEVDKVQKEMDDLAKRPRRRGRHAKGMPTFKRAETENK